MFKKILFLLFVSNINLLVNGLVGPWGQCGGINYNGDTICEIGLGCVYLNDWYYQCLNLPPTPGTAQEWAQCGGIGYTGYTTCDLGLTCIYFNDWYSQCLRTSQLPPIYLTTTTKKTTTLNTGIANEWQQCGGIGYTGPSVCAPGLSCVYLNDWYYQCQKSSQTTTKQTSPTTTQTTIKTTVTQSTTTTSFSGYVQEYGQCGGLGYTGPTQCDIGLICIYINDYYYQCVKTNPPQTTTSSSAPVSTSTRQTSSSVPVSTCTLQTSSTVSSLTLPPSNGSNACDPDFPNAKFRTGISYDQISSVNMGNYDYITIWINTISNDYGTNFNPWYQGKMIEACKTYNKMPVFYAYIIAFEARKQLGLQDCDVNPSYSLCTGGANFIRNNKGLLYERYKHQASSIASAYGTSKPVIFLIEPDFWQYYGDSHQQGGPLTGPEMRDLFDNFVSIIKSQLPKAKISWDISAWIGEAGMKTWWSFFQGADIQFIHTSGGQSRPDSTQIKINELGWSFMSKLTGRNIIADCGYGVAGGLDTNCIRWTNQNDLKNRILDGVIALSEAKENGVVNKPEFNC